MEYTSAICITYILITFIKAVIPLQENLAITLSGDKKMNLSIHEQTVRMKRVESLYLKTTDSNAIKLQLFDNGYRLRFNKYSLYKAPGIDEVAGENFDDENFGFVFDFVSTEKGMKIKGYDKCLEVSKEGNNEDGYPVLLLECQDVERQLFSILRLPAFHKDNHSPSREVLINSK